MPPSVAVTGACGRIGRALVEHPSDRGYPLTLIDRPGCGPAALAPSATAVELDLSKAPPDDLFADVEVVVHLAADANLDADWDSLPP